MVEINFLSIWFPIILSVITGVIWVIVLNVDEFIGCMFSAVAVFLVMGYWVLWLILNK